MMSNVNGIQLTHKKTSTIAAAIAKANLKMYKTFNGDTGIKLNKMSLRYRRRLFFFLSLSLTYIGKMWHILPAHTPNFKRYIYNRLPFFIYGELNVMTV